MKYFKMSNIIICLIFTLIFSSSIFSSPSQITMQDDTIKVKDISTPPVIDGQGNDVCWQNSIWQTIDQVWIPYGGSVSPEDYSGQYKIVWSSEENLLYFLIEIIDDVGVDGFVRNVTADNYNFDITEVFIDEDRSGGLHVFDGTGSTGQQWGTNAENAFSYHIYADFPENSEVITECDVGDIAGVSWNNMTVPNYANHFPEFALTKNENLYTREFSLIVYDSTYGENTPEESRVQLQAGKMMGLSLAYCDNDGPNESPKTRDNFFGSVWVTAAAYNDHWMNADDYGVVKLMPSTRLSVKKYNNE